MTHDRVRAGVDAEAAGPGRDPAAAARCRPPSTTCRRGEHSSPDRPADESHRSRARTAWTVALATATAAALAASLAAGGGTAEPSRGSRPRAPALPHAAHVDLTASSWLPLVLVPRGSTPTPTTDIAATETAGTPRTRTATLPATAGPTATSSAGITGTATRVAATATATAAGTSVPSPALEFNGVAAMRHARAQCDLGPRPPGTDAHFQTGEYARAHFEATGWDVEMDAFEYRGAPLRNVLARQGDGPVLLLAAHYDTRRTADRELDPALRSQPITGANDGASGVAVLLELARVVEVAHSGHEVWLVMFDAEDQGGIDGWEWFVGSTRVAERIAGDPSADFAGLVLLDMVGDLDQRVCRAADSTPELADGVFRAAAELGLDLWLPSDCRYYVSDDHTPFLARGLPAMDMIDFDYPHWHTLADTCDKIGAEPLQRVGQALESWLESGAPQW